MNCEDCGANMRADPAHGAFVCEFCGNTVVPQRDSDGVTVLGDTAESCPVCRRVLATAAIEQLPILYCRQCRGMLIPVDDFAGLIEVLRARRESPPVIAPPSEPRELHRRIECPHCSQAMDTHYYGGPGNVVIDTCERCGVNWLDNLELRRIVAAPDRFFTAD